MEPIRSYILSVTAAAILCAMITSLTGKGGSLASLSKLMSGVILAAVVIRPLAEMTTVNLNRYLDTLNADAMAAVEAGTTIAKDKTAARIKEQLESYILDKAAVLKLDISVEIILDERTQVPTVVKINGAASPSARSALNTILRDDLGIPAEGLIWK